MLRRAPGLFLLPLLCSLSVTAAEENKSLAERRLEVIKGTNEGLKVLDLGSSKAKPPSPAASAATVSAPEGKRTEPTQGQAEPKSALFSKLPPPSGRPLGAARRSEGAGIGIAVPSAGSASQAGTGK
jgi:hypothetical protein